MLLADINFGDVIWSMFIFFFFVILLWMIFGIIGDIFRSDDLSGVSKALWCIALVLIPWFTIFIYLIVRGNGMTERAIKKNQEAQAQFESYVRSTAGADAGHSAAGEITSAKALLDSGAISESEFERIKAKALADAA